MSTIFDKIVSGEMKSWTVWEDDNYMAFLTPFPNTPAPTVVIKKENPGDYVFSVDDESFSGIMYASRKVAKLLEKAFDTSRVGMIFDGKGVTHLHAQLIPFHANLSLDSMEAEEYRKNNSKLVSHLSAVDGLKMDDSELVKIENTRKVVK